MPHHTTDRLLVSARAAGLEVVNQSGLLAVVPPALGFDLHASTLAAAKDRAIQLGTTTEDRVDGLVAELRAAGDAPHDWVSAPFYLDLVLQKPVAAHGSA